MLKSRHAILKLSITFCASFALFASIATIIDARGQAMADVKHDAVGTQALNAPQKPHNARFQKSTMRTALIKDANHILTMSAHDIHAIFAQPELIRAESPTTIWQYRNKACVLDIYFQPPEKSNIDKAPVKHFELRARNKHIPEHIVQKRCMTDLVRATGGITTVSLDAFKK